MTQIGRRFTLSAEQRHGVFCDQDGVFVGGVPLLERHCNSSGVYIWQPRPAIDLNRDLRKHYGLPIELESKMSGLAGVCRALNRGDLVHAQIATLHLQIPDPPVVTKAARTPDAAIDLVRQLRISGLLKQDWDPQKHPRWPAGSPDSIGGQFSPADAGAASAVTEHEASSDQNAQIIPAQLAIPAPSTGVIPFPSEIAPVPFGPPGISPRDLPKNPYPDRPECEQEWAEAYRRCWQLLDSGRLGRDGYRGMGNWLYQCILGQVSEDCGGNPTSRGVDHS